jgi:hypothetical protein
MSKGWNEFYEHVLADKELQEKLISIDDMEVFKQVTVELAASEGYTVSIDEISSSLQNKRRAWLERWLEQ